MESFSIPTTRSGARYGANFGKRGRRVKRKTSRTPRSSTKSRRRSTGSNRKKPVRFGNGDIKYTRLGTYQYVQDSRSPIQGKIRPLYKFVDFKSKSTSTTIPIPAPRTNSHNKQLFYLKK